MTKLDLKCPCGAELHIRSLAAVCAKAYQAFAEVHDPHGTPPAPAPSRYAAPTVRGKNAFGYSKPGGKGYAH